MAKEPTSDIPPRPEPPPAPPRKTVGAEGATTIPYTFEITAPSEMEKRSVAAFERIAGAFERIATVLENAERAEVEREAQRKKDEEERKKRGASW